MKSSGRRFNQPQWRRNAPLMDAGYRRLAMTAITLRRAIASKRPEEVSAPDYDRFVRQYYDGPAGWLTLVSGFLTGHESLAPQVIAPGAFDVRGLTRILDAGCGNGRYLRLLARRADRGAELVGCDLSRGMLRRARKRLGDARAELIAADLRRLPWLDASFDATVAGWVLEHVQDPRVGLRELARVLRPGGKLLVLTVENTVTGALCSRLYHCRTTDRGELRRAAGECGLDWHRDHWWSPLHRALGLGGIVAEFRKPVAAGTTPG